MSLAEFEFDDFLRIWVRLALVFLFLEAYLTVNKIWIRKHEPLVAESISVSAQLLALMTGVPFVMLYIEEGAYEGAVGDGLFLLVNLVMILIGVGFWVTGQRKSSLWSKLKSALSVEKGEASTLLHDLFRPHGARQIIAVLYGLAMIDEHLDDRERAFIVQFADRWDIDFEAALQSGKGETAKAGSVTALRDAMSDYLATTPPEDQALQLRDVLDSLARIDDHISDREELMLEELSGMIDDYTGRADGARFHVYIAPQNKAQELALTETMPDLKKEPGLGGEVFTVGRYHSNAYAQLMCDWYRDSGFLTVTESVSTALEP